MTYLFKVGEAHSSRLVILDKLYHYGVRGPAHLRFQSHLIDRKEMVQINSTVDPRINPPWGLYTFYVFWVGGYSRGDL